MSSPDIAQGQDPASFDLGVVKHLALSVELCNVFNQVARGLVLRLDSNFEFTDVEGTQPAADGAVDTYTRDDLAGWIAEFVTALRAGEFDRYLLGHGLVNPDEAQVAA